MTSTRLDLKLKSNYKGVYYHFWNSNKTHSWKMMISHQGFRAVKTFPFTPQGEYDAAKMYDLKRIEFGKKPVNVLKKKS